PPEAASLRAVKNLRALLDGPWRGRCHWSVSDPLLERETAGGSRPPAVPALARLEGNRATWLPGNPGDGIPPEWLDNAPDPGEAAPARGGATDPADAVAPAWRLALETSPSGSALFLENQWLVYANPAFRQHYRLEEVRALGRRPAEWNTGANVAGLEAALAGTPGGSPRRAGSPPRGPRPP